MSIAALPAVPIRADATLNARFFIVGAGRSGTTLLRLILCGHSRLHVAPETWFIRDLLERLPLAGRLCPGQVSEALDIITSHYRWPDLSISAADLRGDAANLAAPDLRAIIDLVYCHLALAAGKPRIGDKTPVYVQCLPGLAALYPDAKFIHLLRDGRDVALSYISAGWPHRCYQGDAFEWTQAVRAAKAFAGKGRMLELRYEALITSPETEIRRACAFLGEAYETEMLQIGARLDLVPPRERGIHARLGQPVAAQADGGWRQRLGAVPCFVMEACLGHELLTNGYQLRFGGAVWRMPLALMRTLLVTAAPVLLRLVPALQRRGWLADF
jgi:hypothetical protein